MNPKENIKGKLNEIPKGNPFEVPSGYFEGFAARMESQIQGETCKKAGRLLYFALHHKGILSVAASLLIGIVLGSVYLFQSIDQQQNISQAELYQEYEISVINEMSESELISQLANMQQQDIQLSTDSIASDFSQQALDYLSNEGVDIQIIVDEL